MKIRTQNLLSSLESTFSFFISPSSLLFSLYTSYTIPYHHIISYIYIALAISPLRQILIHLHLHSHPLSNIHHVISLHPYIIHFNPPPRPYSPHVTSNISSSSSSLPPSSSFSSSELKPAYETHYSHYIVAYTTTWFICVVPGKALPTYADLPPSTTYEERRLHAGCR